MRFDYAEMDRAARRERARAIAEAFGIAVAWVISHTSRVLHASRPHFAR